jgi:hypothetical protein
MWEEREMSQAVGDERDLKVMAVVAVFPGLLAGS